MALPRRPRVSTAFARTVVTGSFSSTVRAGQEKRPAVSQEPKVPGSPPVPHLKGHG